MCATKQKLSLVDINIHHLHNVGFRCRELFENKYWQPLINSQVQNTLNTSAGAGIVSESSIHPRGYLLKKDQIIIRAVVTVRMSSGNTGFPRDPIFECNNHGAHNRLYDFILIEFYNQKSFSNMALKGFISFSKYLYKSSTIIFKLKRFITRFSKRSHTSMACNTTWW